MNREIDIAISRLPGLLLPWFAANARALPWRENKDPYRVWLSEIMLQQTRVETVIGYYTRFLAAFPTVFALAEADEARVLKLWEGLGYYSRARNLHRTARLIAEREGGLFPGEVTALRALPGVGAYTAGAVASICFDVPVPAVDGNVLRLLARITGSFDCVDETTVREGTAERLAAVYPKGRCGDFTQSLMELGATVCLPNGAPLCERCPAADVCRALQNGWIGSLPVRKAKKKRAVRDLTYLILDCGGKTALRRRTEKGVLRGMWEFPNVDGLLDESAALRWLRACYASETSGAPPVPPESPVPSKSSESSVPHESADGEPDAPKTTLAHGLQPTFRVRNVRHGRHIFTHIEWRVLCYEIDCSAACAAFVWAGPDELLRDFALPAAFQKFRPARRDTQRKPDAPTRVPNIKK
ncbi:MAG: A/G-specific adenine glycosylase [Clostridiales bacterium]|jgi:A/G-specific adenine glycosylase|nr:A/G-specific adenine glycosylase [Clostridiales bacterium]